MSTKYQPALPLLLVPHRALAPSMPIVWQSGATT